MESLEHFRKLFAYDAWANGEAIAGVKSIGENSGRARKLLGHLLGAQRVWLGRFESPDPPNAEPWPNLPLEDAGGIAEELHQQWTELLGKLAPQRLDEALTYRNTKGIEFRTSVRDILAHLLMHSAYHRGQIALAVREVGGKPAVTDYVVYVRQAKGS